jgi:hypothetical protein
VLLILAKNPRKNHEEIQGSYAGCLENLTKDSSLNSCSDD